MKAWKFGLDLDCRVIIFFFFLDKDIRQTKSNIEEERVIMYIINTPKTPWKENLHLNI